MHLNLNAGTPKPCSASNLQLLKPHSLAIHTHLPQGIGEFRVYSLGFRNGEASTIPVTGSSRCCEGWSAFSWASAAVAVH